MIALLTQHPGILEAATYGCEDDDIAEVEGALGFELPIDLASLLRFSDGGVLHGPTRAIHLASSEELVEWARDGVAQRLEALPFARDDTGIVLVTDTSGDWGGPDGAVFRLEVGRRHIHGHPVQDAIKIADSLSDLLEHLAAGRDAW